MEKKRLPCLMSSKPCLRPRLSFFDTPAMLNGWQGKPPQRMSCAGMSATALDAADVGRIEISTLRRFELREVERLAAFADIEAEGCEGSGAGCFRHDRECARSWTMSLWTMSQNVLV